MNVINKNINEIKPYERNPRNNNEAVKYVANSIKEFGFKVPLVIDKNGTIIAGHTRYKACKQLGINEIPCIIADDLTEEQIKAFRLADNKVGEIAEWDFDMLDLELDDIELDMTDFGFEDIVEEVREIKKVELKPYKKVHYLISCDINKNDKIINLLESVKNEEDIEIESTLN